MVVLSDGQLCTGDSAGFIQMWDLSTGELERCYPGHSLDVDEDAEQDTCCVRSLIQLQDGRLGTASVDHTVRVWTQSEGDCVLTCIGHKGPVNSVVQLRDGRLCSGSDDRALIIWSVINGECLLTLEGHLKGILSVIEMQDGSICSGTWGGKVIRIWEPVNGECVKVLAGILGEIISVFQLQDGRLCGIADNHNLRIWF
jgi:WD40 repeat protein